jgi:hypothetical protein
LTDAFCSPSWVLCLEILPRTSPILPPPSGKSTLITHNRLPRSRRLLGVFVMSLP